MPAKKKKTEEQPSAASEQEPQKIDNAATVDNATVADTPDTPEAPEKPAPAEKPRILLDFGLPAHMPPVYSVWEHWPRSQVKRTFREELSEHDRAVIAGDMSENIRQHESVKAQAKAAASAYKAQMEAIQKQLSDLSDTIEAGKEVSVPCIWIYETSGLTPDKTDWLYSPNQKCLVRMDTGDVLTVANIMNDEREAAIPLEANPEISESEAASLIDQSGFEVQPSDLPEGPAFFLVSKSGDIEPIGLEGVDSMRSALQAALVKIESMLADSEGSTAPHEPDMDPTIEECGEEARRLNVPLIENPYPEGTEEATLWKAGWAKKDAEINDPGFPDEPDETGAADEGEAEPQFPDSDDEDTRSIHWHAGFTAFGNKVRREACPHVAGSFERGEWRAGWDTAADQAEQAEQGA